MRLSIVRVIGDHGSKFGFRSLSLEFFFLYGIAAAKMGQILGQFRGFRMLLVEILYRLPEFRICGSLAPLVKSEIVHSQKLLIGKLLDQFG